MVPNSNGEDNAPLLEVNHCHGPGRGHPCVGRGEFDPFDDPSYSPPTLTHKVVRDDGMWGSSHGNSSAITGAAAALMGIPGYHTSNYHEPLASNRATKFLREIAADGTGSEEPLYHGFENVRETAFTAGDTLRLPLTATAGSRSDASGYGVRLDVEDQKGQPTVFEFPKDTQMVGYSKWKMADAKEFGYVWSEAVVAGGFRVTRVREAENSYRWQFDRAGKTAHHPTIRIVTLEQTETFDPTKGWMTRG